MITPTVKTGQPHIVTTKVGGKRFILALYKVPSTMYKAGNTKYGKYAIVKSSVKNAEMGKCQST